MRKHSLVFEGDGVSVDVCTPVAAVIVVIVLVNILAPHGHQCICYDYGDRTSKIS